MRLQRHRDAGAACGNDDRVERPRDGPALAAVAGDQIDVFVTKGLQALVGPPCERLVPLDRADTRGDATQHRGRVARAGADLKDRIRGSDFGRLDHRRHDIGLRDRLPLSDG